MHAYVSPQDPSAQLSTVLNWIEALSRRDFSACGELMAEDYKHSVLPGSKGPVASNKREGIDVAEKATRLLKTIKFELYAVNESPGNIWIHLMQRAVTNEGDHTNAESMQLFALDQGPNPKITVMDEFVDTKKAE